MDEAFCISSVITLALLYSYFDQKMLEIVRMIFHTEHFRKGAEQLLLSAEGHYCKCGCYDSCNGSLTSNCKCYMYSNVVGEQQLSVCSCLIAVKSFFRS